MENIDRAVQEYIDIDINKEILENIDIDKISNRLEFGISNRARRMWKDFWGPVKSSCEKRLQIFLIYGASKKIFGRYLHPRGLHCEKIIFYFFSQHGLIAPHTKFHVSQTSPSCFLLIYDPFLTNIWRKYLSCNLFTVLHHPKL